MRLYFSPSGEDLARLTEQFVRERTQAEDPRHWVQRAYPAWAPAMHFAIALVIREGSGFRS
jgi:hypothetical protein